MHPTFKYFHQLTIKVDEKGTMQKENGISTGLLPFSYVININLHF